MDKVGALSLNTVSYSDGITCQKVIPSLEECLILAKKYSHQISSLSTC